MNEKRVLIIDDEPLIRHALASHLAECGYETAMAVDGAGGLTQARAKQFHVVLVDLRMPRVDGLEVIATLKAEQPELPLVVVSGTGVLEDAIEAIRRGAWDYVTKPIRDMDEIVVVVERVLERARLIAERDRYQRELEHLNRSLEAEVARQIEALRRSEAKFRHIYDNAPVMMYSIDEDGNICDVNRKWLEETGYTREEVIGQSADFLLPPESVERAFSVITPRFQRDGFVRDVPYQYRKKSGAVIDVLFDCEATTDPFGKHVCLAVVRNVTEQKRTERRLHLQSAALESAANAIVITNRYGRIGWVNPAFTLLTGYTLEEATGQTMRILRSGQQDQSFYQNLWETILSGQVWQGELVNRRKDGSLYIEEQFITPVLDEGGEISHFVVIKQDITERRRMRAKMVQADRLAAVGKLAASVAREINNPLQAIIGCLDLIQEALAEGEDADEYLQVAQGEVNRIAHIVARLRDLYRPESGEREGSDVNALVEQVLDLIRKRCQESQVEVDWSPATEVPLLFLAPDQIKQAFLNLILNAIEAMPGGGRLQVSTAYTREPAGVRIQFSDSGEGILPDVLPHIFEMFYSTRPVGTGLGLPISSNIVAQHGGRIEVESQPGEGSTFTVWLPVRRVN